MALKVSWIDSCASMICCKTNAELGGWIEAVAPVRRPREQTFMNGRYGVTRYARL